MRNIVKCEEQTMRRKYKLLRTRLSFNILSYYRGENCFTSARSQFMNEQIIVAVITQGKWVLPALACLVFLNKDQTKCID